MTIIAEKTGLVLSEQKLERIKITAHEKGEALRRLQRQLLASEHQQTDINRFMAEFLTQVLDYSTGRLNRTPTKEKDGIYLEETMSIEKPDMIYTINGEKIMIMTLTADSLNAKEERSNHYRIGYFTKFERFLRKSGSKYGWLTNGETLRFVYAGEGLSTAWLEWDIDDLEHIPQQLDTFCECFGEARMNAKKDNLFALIRQSQDEAGELTDRLSAQVLEALTLLVSKLDNNTNDLKKTYQTLVRTIMRMIFLLYAEETGIFPHGDRTYDENYGIIYMANELLIARRKGHEELLSGFNYWYRLLALFNLVYYGSTHPELNVVAHGGMLFDPKDTTELQRIEVDNASLESIFNKLLIIDGARVTYRSLEVEQIGFIYEDLLNYDLTADETGVHLHESMERKSSGSYYTRPELVSYVVEKTLAPLTENKKSTDILKLKICDPAMGSGAFLVKTQRYLSQKLAEAWSTEGKYKKLSREELEKEAKRLVTQNCLYGVDINPMAVELSKISLWLETLSADRSFTFLDHHLRVGNSLIGVWGDEDITKINKEIYKYNKKNSSDDYRAQVKSKSDRNKAEETGQHQLFETAFNYEGITKESLKIIQNAGKNKDYETLETLYNEFKNDENRLKEKMKRDIYLAGWFANPYDDTLPLTTTELMDEYAKCEKGDHSDFTAFAEKMATEQKFFHWDLEFPEVFQGEGKKKGFDAVVGNPPWESVELKELEFFADRVSGISEIKKKDERTKEVNKLKIERPEIYEEFKRTAILFEKRVQLWKNTERFSRTSGGKVNLYALFAEQFVNLSKNRMGIIVPTGLFTDQRTSEYFASLVEKKVIAEINDFENRKALFGNVHRSYRFSLFIIGKSDDVKMRIALTDPQQLFEQAYMTLKPEEIAMFNPNTKTLPMLKSSKDLEIMNKIYSRSSVVYNESTKNEKKRNPLGIDIFTIFNMATHSYLFRRRSVLEAEGFVFENGNYVKEDEKYLPLYEGKSFYVMDSRYNRIEEDGNGYAVSDEEKSDPGYFPKCRYYVRERDFVDFISAKSVEIKSKWLIAYRKISRSTDSRTLVLSPTNLIGFGDSVYCITANEFLPIILLSTHIIDFIVRNKQQGANINKFIFNQLPIIPPEKLKQLPPITFNKNTQETAQSSSKQSVEFSVSPNNSKAFVPQTPNNTKMESPVEFSASSNTSKVLVPQTLEDSIKQIIINLTNYAYDLEPFVKELGGTINPRPWNEEERLNNFAKLDAIVAHLYGLTKEELKHIFSDFKGEAKNQKEKYGEYISERLAFEYFENYTIKTENL